MKRPSWQAIDKRIHDLEKQVSELRIQRAFTLTPKQHEIARIMAKCYITRGVWATMGEIGEQMGISKITVWDHCTRMVAKGAMVQEYGAYRGYALSDRCMKIPRIIQRDDLKGLWTDSDAVQRCSDLLGIDTRLELFEPSEETTCDASTLSVPQPKPEPFSSRDPSTSSPFETPLSEASPDNS